MWDLSFAGTAYMFGSISPVIKSTMGFNQQQVVLLSVAKDLGDCVGLLSGKLSEVWPTWRVMLVGVIQNLVGYGLVWLVVTHSLPSLPLWTLSAYRTSLVVLVAATAQRKFAYPRLVALAVIQLVMCLGLLYYALGLVGQVYVLAISMGYGFGAQWSVGIAATSELFGLKNFGTLYNFLTMANPAGSLILSGFVASTIYDYYAEQQAKHNDTGGTNEFFFARGLRRVHKALADMKCLTLSMEIMRWKGMDSLPAAKRRRQSKDGGEIEASTLQKLSPVVIFAHGAGAPSSSDWMLRWKTMLKEALHAADVVTFDYPWLLLRQKKLVEFHSNIVKETATKYPGHPLILAGKSMGSRVGCMVASMEDINVSAVVCLGYPLKGINGAVRDDTLLQLTVPTMFVQGSKDGLCPLEKLEAAQ
ncbi:Nodulin-like [Sesbania bispinosa]|nr:Nodulin-like [Sesbania bispinosa]